MSASSLAEVRAARGGLDGGEGIPERTSGIPLCPWRKIDVSMDYLISGSLLQWKRGQRRTGPGKHTAGAGSGVMEASEAGRHIYDVGTGEDSSLTTSSLAMTITTTMAVVIIGSHCFGELPRLRK